MFVKKFFFANFLLRSLNLCVCVVAVVIKFPYLPIYLVGRCQETPSYYFRKHTADSFVVSHQLRWKAQADFRSAASSVVRNIEEYVAKRQFNGTRLVNFRHESRSGNASFSLSPSPSLFLSLFLSLPRLVLFLFFLVPLISFLNNPFYIRSIR